MESNASTAKKQQNAVVDAAKKEADAAKKIQKAEAVAAKKIQKADAVATKKQQKADAVAAKKQQKADAVSAKAKFVAEKAEASNAKKAKKPEAVVEKNDIDGLQDWSKTVAFAGMANATTQAAYYNTHGATEAILKIVDLPSKQLGTYVEKIVIESLGLGPRTSTQNDATFNGKKIEIKAARYWSGKDECVWQHLEPDHDYDYALFVLIDFQTIKAWSIKKSLLMGELREKNIVTPQGKQGFWTKKSALMPYLTPIFNIKDLHTSIM